jgi:cellulose synthase (UDP-forming)
MTGTKSTFTRTPKVAHRTVATIPSIVVPYAIVAVSAYIVWRAIEIQAWGTAVFAGINGLTTAWAIVSLIGIRTSVADVWLRWTDWLWVAQPQPDAEAGESGDHWRRALDEGEIGAPARAPRSRRASSRSAKTQKPVAA